MIITGVAHVRTCDQCPIHYRIVYPNGDTTLPLFTKSVGRRHLTIARKVGVVMDVEVKAVEDQLDRLEVPDFNPAIDHVVEELIGMGVDVEETAHSAFFKGFEVFVEMTRQ